MGTFNSIYEKGPYFSYAELFARRNLVALQPSTDLKLSEVRLVDVQSGFFLAREHERRPIQRRQRRYRFGLEEQRSISSPRRPSTQLQWRMTRNLTWFTEYGHFFPGDFLKQVYAGPQPQLLDRVAGHQVLSA